MILRAVLLYALFFVLVGIVGWTEGAPFTVRFLVEAAAYALIALGLNIQWGYGGLFNFGILGLVMLGGFAVTAMAMPVSTEFWGSDGPWLIGRAIIAAGIGALLIIGAGRLDRIGFSRGWKRAAQVLAWIVAYIGFRTQIDPAVESIEASVGWIGGLGLPSWVGWIFGGILAAGIAWLIGKVTLGLRSDYLAIATIGIAEIVRALIKNMEWLTRGTLTVSPVPWPVPLPQDYQADGIAVADSFVYARAGYLLLVLAVLFAVLLLVQRAYAGPWGRMMRAIRDNHIAAGAMGKDVRARQLQLFVLGSALIGVGGAMLTSFTQIYDPSGYQTIDHTFLIWVMVIVGGAGNNFGAVFGGMLIYLVWVMSDPVSQTVFTTISDWFVSWGWSPIPEIESRALQMRVFILGLVIVLSLRYAPRGLIPEVIGKVRGETPQPPAAKAESPD